MSSVEHNKAVVADFFRDYWTNAEGKNLERTCHPDFALTYPLCGTVKGIDNARSMMTGLKMSFPDISFRPVGTLIAEGDYVVGRFEGGGTHTGPPFRLAVGGLDQANSGRKIQLTGMAVYRLVDGLIIEEIGEEGAVDVVQQLGLYTIA